MEIKMHCFERGRTLNLFCLTGIFQFFSVLLPFFEKVPGQGIVFFSVVRYLYLRMVYLNLNKKDIHQKRYYCEVGISAHMRRCQKIPCSVST